MDETKYKGRYRISSARAWWHQYNGGTYFVTICTKNREHLFGEIKDGVITLSMIGEYLNQQILSTPEVRPDMNLEIPTFTIMPNHVHLLVVIGDNVYNTPVDYMSEQKCMDSLDALENSFSPQRKNLASVIRGIKTATTSFALKNDIWFGWQARYHDHIVRDIDELNAISCYIENNVAKWKEDEFYDGK
jgi:REP element-mobilizing transposase RayT